MSRCRIAHVVVYGLYRFLSILSGVIVYIVSGFLEFDYTNYQKHS